MKISHPSVALIQLRTKGDNSHSIPDRRDVTPSSRSDSKTGGDLSTLPPPLTILALAFRGGDGFQLGSALETCFSSDARLAVSPIGDNLRVGGLIPRQTNVVHCGYHTHAGISRLGWTRRLSRTSCRVYAVPPSRGLRALGCARSGGHGYDGCGEPRTPSGALIQHLVTLNRSSYGEVMVYPSGLLAGLLVPRAGLQG